MGEMDNTLVLFTSDNGPSPLARYHERGETAPGSTEGLRGRKFSLYEGGIRQPLILYWRGHMKAGTRDAHTVAKASTRSEERRVGKEVVRSGSNRWSPCH